MSSYWKVAWRWTFIAGIASGIWFFLLSPTEIWHTVTVSIGTFSLAIPCATFIDAAMAPLLLVIFFAGNEDNQFSGWVGFLIVVALTLISLSAIFLFGAFFGIFLSFWYGVWIVVRNDGYRGGLAYSCCHNGNHSCEVNEVRKRRENLIGWIFPSYSFAVAILLGFSAGVVTYVLMTAAVLTGALVSMMLGAIGGKAKDSWRKSLALGREVKKIATRVKKIATRWLVIPETTE